MAGYYGVLEPLPDHPAYRDPSVAGWEDDDSDPTSNLRERSKLRQEGNFPTARIYSLKQGLAKKVYKAVGKGLYYQAATLLEQDLQQAQIMDLIAYLSQAHHRLAFKYARNKPGQFEVSSPELTEIDRTIFSYTECYLVYNRRGNNTLWGHLQKNLTSLSYAFGPRVIDEQNTYRMVIHYILHGITNIVLTHQQSEKNQSQNKIKVSLSNLVEFGPRFLNNEYMDKSLGITFRIEAYTHVPNFSIQFQKHLGQLLTHSRSYQSCAVHTICAGPKT
jgi:hypothetical protein